MEIGSQTFQLGQDGFIWFIGVVKGRQDPLTVGRVKVRIFGYHNPDSSKLSDEDLPWAYPLLPVTASTQTPNYKDGDWVVGFFLDAKLAQKPIILGVLPTIAQH